MIAMEVRDAHARPDVYILPTNTEASSDVTAQNDDDNGCKKVIINELLSFAVHKLRFLPHDTIHMLCCKFYSEDEIEYAKKILYDYCSERDQVGRCIFRKGPKKTSENMQDILRLIQMNGREMPVTFVAADLNRLPCVTFNDIDVCTLLERMSKMDMEVSLLRETVSKQANICEEIKNTCINGAAVSGSAAGITDCNRETSRQEMSGTMSAGETLSLLDDNDGVARDDVVMKKKNPSYARTLKEGTVVKKRENSATANNGTKRKVSAIVGKGKNVAIKPALKSPPRLANVFASRLDPNLTCSGLQEYLAAMLEIEESSITVELIKRNRWLTSFHVTCRCENPRIFMNPNIWPEDAYVRWWRESKPRSTGSNVDNPQNNDRENGFVQATGRNDAQVDESDDTTDVKAADSTHVHDGTGNGEMNVTDDKDVSGAEKDDEITIMKKVIESNVTKALQEMMEDSHSPNKEENGSTTD